MLPVFEKTNFNDISFVSKLAEDGFDIHNIGGEQNPAFNHGEVYRFQNGQYQLMGNDTAIVTCSANTFFKTLTDVESRFNYQLFG